LSGKERATKKVEKMLKGRKKYFKKYSLKMSKNDVEEESGKF
jgi:hypothetical protein